MCAIAGLLTSQGERSRYIRRMAALMGHRGPDDEGFLFQTPAGIRLSGGATDSIVASSPTGGERLPGAGENSPDAWLALGHRRLSILDLSPMGHQPMPYRGRYWIVYNGEVYNFLELRTELLKAGHQFQSQCRSVES